jgi:hypothetical protein
MSNTLTPRNRRIRADLDPIITSIEPGTEFEASTIAGELDKISISRRCEITPRHMSCFLKERDDLVPVGRGVWRKLEAAA